MDIALLRRNYWDEMAEPLSNTLDNKCTHKCRWLIGPHCRGNVTPSGRCIRRFFYDGGCMCANCQKDIIYRVSQNVARRDGFSFLDEEHDASSCTRLWAKPYKYIYVKADSPSSASSASSDYPWDKPWKEIPRHILLEEGMLQRECDGGSTPSSVANSDILSTPGVPNAALTRTQTLSFSSGIFRRSWVITGNSLAR